MSVRECKNTIMAKGVVANIDHVAIVNLGMLYQL